MAAGALADAVALIDAGDLAHVEATRREVLAFCAEHPDALHRSNTTAHLTSSALVIDPADGRFVVLHHRKLDRWLQPGGHADGDGDLAAVALREAREETGLDGLLVLEPAVDLDVHEVRPPGEPPHLHLDLRFLVVAVAGAAAAGPPPGNHESHEVRWVTPADLDDLDADESLRRLVQRGLQHEFSVPPVAEPATRRTENSP
jgi:8-oxo-dGTP pyrophosphatase MutT (NUDIX family)